MTNPTGGEPSLPQGWTPHKATSGEGQDHLDLVSGDSTIKKISCRVLSGPNEKRTWGETFGLRSRVTIKTGPNDEDSVTVKVWNSDFGKAIGFGGMRTHISQVIEAQSSFIKKNVSFLKTLEAHLLFHDVSENTVNDIMCKLSTELTSAAASLKTIEDPIPIYGSNYSIIVSKLEEGFSYQLTIENKNKEKVGIIFTSDNEASLSNKEWDLEAFQEGSANLLSGLKSTLKENGIPDNTIENIQRTLYIILSERILLDPSQQKNNWTIQGKGFTLTLERNKKNNEAIFNFSVPSETKDVQLTFSLTPPLTLPNRTSQLFFKS